MKHKKQSPLAKPGLHPRNRHRFRYDFKTLLQSSPELKSFIKRNPRNQETIDFSNPQAVKTLNRALLKHYYDLMHWDIPPNYLCPPIPGRADYIHYLADLLGNCQGKLIPRGKNIRVLDIGTGASCIYPIIGQREYGWSFVGSDSDEKALQSSRFLIESNPALKSAIECRQQNDSTQIFKGIILPHDYFELTLSNPPFYKSAAEARSANQRKNKNLGKKNQPKTGRNFGGQNHELWYPGGELGFVQKMITESQDLKKHCLWFTSLVSAKDHLPKLYHTLERIGVKTYKTLPMAQGQKISRILAWTYLNEGEIKDWVQTRWKRQ